MYGIDEIDTRSKANVRDNGEVFTPFKIVSQMLELLPQTAWADPEMIFLEPTCGNGQFLIKIVEKRIDSGISIEEAFNTLIGMDISKENITDAHARLFAVAANAMKQDGIIPNTEKWFDLAIRIVAIVRNNIFVVDDSLRVMADYGSEKGELAKKKFVFNDPCENKPMSENVRAGKINKILSNFEKESPILQPFFEV